MAGTRGTSTPRRASCRVSGILDRALPRACFCCLACAWLAGCIAIPMGSEEFSTEYPGEIRDADEPAEKTYAPFAVFERAVDAAGVTEIGLVADVTVRQARLQHFETVSLTKTKMFSVGIAPGSAWMVYSPNDALVPAEDKAYCGGGTYGGGPPLSEPGAAECLWGYWLRVLTLGAVSTPLTFLAELFGPFESDCHYVGRRLAAQDSRGEELHDRRDILLLEKFSPEDRKRIGAWTWHENDTHRHNTFWRGFSGEIFGVAKYCNYVVHEPEESPRTVPAAAQTGSERRAAVGPYGVFLQIPELGFAQTMGVLRGETRARFNLANIADGRKEARGYIRFLPPSGGMEEAWDDDARAMLGAVQGKEFAVTLQMPPPRLEETPVPAPATARPDVSGGLYTIIGVQRTATGGLKVRARLADSARAVDADRELRPKVLENFRKKMGPQNGGEARERVKVHTEEGGRVLVYGVEAEMAE